jgi:hypothetical protein
MGIIYCRFSCFWYVTWNRNQTSAAYVAYAEVRALSSPANILASLCKLPVVRRTHGWSATIPTHCAQENCASVRRRRWRLSSLAKASFRAVLLERGGCWPYPRFGQVAGLVWWISWDIWLGVRCLAEMASFLFFREHLGLWTVTKFGVTRRLIEW